MSDMLIRAVLSLSILAAWADTVQAQPTDAPLGSARGSDEHWAAYSQTAMSTTGDIQLSPHELKAAGHTFPLDVVATLPAYEAIFGKTPARVLRLTHPSDPTLLNGNKLGCGTPIQWIVVYHLKDQTTLGMDAFDGREIPKSEKDPTLCAIFTYTLR